MIHPNILYLLLGVLISAFIFFIYHSRYRRRISIQLDKKRELEKEVITLKEREKIQIQELSNAELQFKERLEEQKAQSTRLLEMHKDSFNLQMKTMEAQFESLSEKITKQRAEELSRSNSTSMNVIINPLKETIEKMEKSLKDNNEKGAERIGSLREQINSLVNHTTMIGNKADDLSNALRMKSKIQGNWGETILETLLQSEGLEEYIHYEAQKTIKDDQNRTLYPDFVIRLPDNRVVIIDAKVSLNAYSDYHAAEDETSKSAFLKSHINSVRQHVKELADKKYYKHMDKEFSTPDFVIMFVPIPGALQLALENDSKLYQEATKQGIFLSSTQSIMPILWVIKDLWTQTKQERNMEEIVRNAQHLLNRLANFFDDFEKIELSLEQAKKAYENADKKMRGQQSILVSAKRIKEAGIKLQNNKKLPDLLIDNENDGLPMIEEDTAEESI